METHLASRGVALRLVGPLVSGLLYAAAQPDRGVWPLAFVCLIPLLLGLRGASPLRRALLGGVAGAVAGSLLVLQPVSVAIGRYFDVSLPPAVAAAFVLVLLFGAVPFALFGCLVGDCERAAPWTLAPRAGAAMLLCELVRSNLLGLPWGLLGYALAPAPALAQGASLFGASGLSFMLAACSGALVALMRAPRSGPAWAMLSASLLAFVLPMSRMPAPEASHLGAAAVDAEPASAAIRVALVQGALHAAGRGEPARVREDLERLLALDRDPDTELAVWPESAVSVVLPVNFGIVESVVREATPRARWILAGAPRSDPQRPGPPLNSAVLLDADGRIVDHHDKVRLVPLAEVRLGPFGGRSRHQGGSEVGPLELGPLRPGVLVCYEVLFAGMARELAKAGAGVLVNISNDEWFDGTRGLEQHFAPAVLRAIELRRPVLRAANTGITAGIDSAGRIRGRLPPGLAGVLRMDVAPARSQTLYQRLGDWLLWPSLAIGAWGLALGRA